MKSQPGFTDDFPRIADAQVMNLVPTRQTPQNAMHDTG